MANWGGILGTMGGWGIGQFSPTVSADLSAQDKAMIAAIASMETSKAMSPEDQAANMAMVAMSVISRANDMGMSISDYLGHVTSNNKAAFEPVLRGLVNVDDPMTQVDPVALQAVDYALENAQNMEKATHFQNQQVVNERTNDPAKGYGFWGVDQGLPGSKFGTIGSGLHSHAYGTVAPNNTDPFSVAHNAPISIADVVAVDPATNPAVDPLSPELAFSPEPTVTNDLGFVDTPVVSSELFSPDPMAGGMFSSINSPISFADDAAEIAADIWGGIHSGHPAPTPNPDRLGDMLSGTTNAPDLGIGVDVAPEVSTDPTASLAAALSGTQSMSDLGIGTSVAPAAAVAPDAVSLADALSGTTGMADLGIGTDVATAAVSPDVSVSATGYGAAAPADTTGYGASAAANIADMGGMNAALSGGDFGDPAGLLGFSAGEVAAAKSADPFGAAADVAADLGSEPTFGVMGTADPSSDLGGYIDSGFDATSTVGDFSGYADHDAMSLAGLLGDVSTTPDSDYGITPHSVETVSISAAPAAAVAPAATSSAPAAATAAPATSAAPAATSAPADAGMWGASAPASTATADSDSDKGGLFGGLGSGNIGGMLGGGIGTAVGGPVGGLIGGLVGSAIGGAVSGNTGGMFGGLAGILGGIGSGLGGLGGGMGGMGGGIGGAGVSGSGGGFADGGIGAGGFSGAADAGLGVGGHGFH